MTKLNRLGFCVALASLFATSAQAGVKIDSSCFYESGQNGNQVIADFTILNTASFPIPKNTVVHFTTETAPGKFFTAKAPANVAPQDTFSTGGNFPVGSCTAWWFK